MILAIASVTLLGVSLGLVLGYAAQKLRVEGDPLVDELTAMLPASNCAQCGFAGCRQAAEALARHEAPVTLCPPGGKAVAQKLAERLGISADLSGMSDGPKLADVREEFCIGCTKCMKVCPTDAILGAPKMIHYVLSEACTGCGACVDVCPTEAVLMAEVVPCIRTWVWPKPLQEAA
jgi:electron transport complex protein RnfB